jgi:hypothetical protein
MIKMRNRSKNCSHYWPQKHFTRVILALMILSATLAQASSPKPKVSPRPSPKPQPSSTVKPEQAATPVDIGVAQLIPSDNPLETLGGLQWLDTNLKVKIETKNGVPTPFVQLRGRLQRDGWSLFYGKTWLLKASAPSREFRFNVDLTGEETIVLLGGAGPNRKTQRIIVRIVFKDFSKYGDDKSRSRFRLVAALGPSYVTYQEQTGVLNTDFKTIILTAKVTARYELLPRKWDLGFNTFFSAFQITNGYSDKSVSTRFLGINLRLGYTFPSTSKWSFGLNGGWYYTTMLVTGKRFGFMNMAGPQLYPLLVGRLNNGKVLSFYAKYSPIIGLGFANREIAGGAGYSVPLTNGHPMIFNFDYANISFDLLNQKTSAGATVNSSIRSSSISLSAGYGF